MPDIATHRYGGYENLNLTQAEIAARAYNAGLPPSVRPITSNNSYTFTPVRMVKTDGKGTIEYGVAIDPSGGVLWCDKTTGVVINYGNGGINTEIFSLPGNLGLCLYNSITGSTWVAYTAYVWLSLTDFSGKYLKNQCGNHNYWDSNYGVNY